MGNGYPNWLAPDEAGLIVTLKPTVRVRVALGCLRHGETLELTDARLTAYPDLVAQAREVLATARAHAPEARKAVQP